MKLIPSIIMGLSRRGFLKLIPDESYLKTVYFWEFGHRLNLINPTTFNEKIQWLKLYDRCDLYTELVDKFVVREYVRSRIGEEYLIPLLGKWDRAEDIDFELLPNSFVLKCNHDSGSVVVCKDKSNLDKKYVLKKMSKHLKQGTYYYGREWPYKNIKPCIIAEQYMEDSTTKELRDYKFFTFNGIVKAMYIATDRQSKDMPTTFDFFDAKFNHLDFRQGHPNAKHTPEKPKNYDLMINLAEKLSKGLNEVRVDFYEMNGKVYFGEMTFFHNCGFTRFDPEKWDAIFGEWLTLPSVKLSK